MRTPINYGGIAQLVERQLCKLEVWGSNPHASTFRIYVKSTKHGDRLEQTIATTTARTIPDANHGPIAQLVRAPP